MDSLLDGTTFPVQGAEKHGNDPLVYLVKDDCAMLAEYRCPITKMPMKNPVVMSDGHSYECLAIEEWLRTSGVPVVSPVTGRPLATTTMTANHALKLLILEWSISPAGLSYSALTRFLHSPVLHAMPTRPAKALPKKRMRSMSFK